MTSKKLMILSIFLVSLFAISAVNAADNATGDIVGTDETTDEVVSVEENQVILKENDVGNFQDLIDDIYNADNELNLTRNYTYDDPGLEWGLIIDKDIVINGNGFTINGNYQAAIFSIVEPRTVVLNNITFANSCPDMIHAIDWGSDNGVLTNCNFINMSSGALTWSGANGTLANCTFVGCDRNYDDGVVYWSGDDGTLADCSFVDCNRLGWGRAVYWAGSKGIISGSNFRNCFNTAVFWQANDATLIDCSFSHCLMDSAVYSAENCDNCTIANCNFESCRADWGGAIKWHGNGVVIDNCSFEACVADGDAGAVYLDGIDNTIKKSNFIDCHAERYGGAAYLIGSGRVADSTFTSCKAPLAGGGIYFSSTDFILKGNTFKNNYAYSGPDYYPEDMPTGATTLTATSVTATYGAKQYIIAVLKDSTGNTISNARIGFATPNGMKYVNTDANGKARYYTNELLPGTYKITIKYYGDDTYEESNKATSKVVINKIATTLTVTNLQTPYKSNKYIIAVLKDENGKTLSNARIAFATPNGMKYVNTDANGKARYYTNELEEGSYNIKVAYYADKTHQASNIATSKVVITKIVTKLSVTSLSTTLNSGKYILAVLTDDNGKAISGARIGFATPNGMKYINTDANGKARLYVDDFKEGTYDIRVAYYGNDTYKASNKATSKVTISKMATKLGVTSVTATYGSNKYIIAVLTDANDKVISNAKIGFATPNGMKYVNTDANGKARLYVSDFAVGTYNVKVAYYGDDTYMASNKATSKVTITE